MLNPTDQKLFFVLLAVCTLLAARVVLRRVRVIASGAPMPAARSSFAERFKNLLVYVPGQWSNIRNIRLNDTAGLTHRFIFWGFYALVIYYAIFEVLHHGLGLFDGLPKHPVAIAFTQVVEILGCLLVFALLTAVGRRAILKLKRLGPHFEVVPMALLALAALLVVGCFLILQGVRDGYGLTTAGPVAELVAAWFTGADGEPMAGLYRTVWWTQAVLILIAIVYIPYSRHQHPIFAPFNIWLKDRRNEGRIIKIDVADIGKRPDGRAGAKLTSELQSETTAGSIRVHAMRPLPGRVPGRRHRQTAVAEGRRTRSHAPRRRTGRFVAILGKSEGHGNDYRCDRTRFGLVVHDLFGVQRGVSGWRRTDGQGHRGAQGPGDE